MDLPRIQERAGIWCGRFAVFAGVGGRLLFYSGSKSVSPGAGDERNLASQLRSQKLGAKPWNMADCRMVDLVFVVLGGYPSLTAARDPGLDERPMDTGRRICDS